MKSIRPFLVSIGVSLISIIILCLLLEIGMRWKIFFDDRKLIQASQALSGKSSSTLPEKTRQLRHLIRWSNNPRIIYELIPNLSIIFKKHLLKTNSKGFRGPEYPEKKAENIIRKTRSLAALQDRPGYKRTGLSNIRGDFRNPLTQYQVAAISCYLIPRFYV